MKEIKTLDELHSILLNIAKVFDKICREHDIPYYMLGGTMLGAIRHKGFIPWDDDMDFGVERQYYDKLLKILAKELPSPYKLNTMYNSSIISDACKISDDSTGMIEGSRTDIGINIDIFPLDHTNGKKGKLSKNNIVHKIGVLNAIRFSKVSDYNGIRRLVTIISKIIMPNIKNYTLIKFANKHFISKGDSISNLYGFWGVKETMPFSYMGTPTLYKFEDTKFYGAENYDGYLKSLYNHYMEIPPVDKRHVHLNKCWYK